MSIKKIIQYVVFAICFLVVLSFASEALVSFFSISAAEKVRALLAPSAEVSSLPRQVTISIDGATSTFTQGTDGYKQMLALLRLRHLDDAWPKAGPYAPVSSFSRCGELTIRQFGLPYHCRLSRSAVNPNILMIAIPYGNRRPGSALPLIIDDNLISSLVHGKKTTLQPNQSGTTRSLKI